MGNCVHYDCTGQSANIAPPHGSTRKKIYAPKRTRDQKTIGAKRQAIHPKDSKALSHQNRPNGASWRRPEAPHSPWLLNSSQRTSSEQEAFCSPPRWTPLPDGAVLFSNLHYTANADLQQTLDLYIPQRCSPCPIILSIHNGTQQNGKECDVPAEYLSLGYAIASINYRIREGTEVLSQIQDCKAAVRWLRANAAEYRLDGNHIAAWGVSHGAYLATMLGTTAGNPQLDIGEHLDQSSEVQAVVDYCGHIGGNPLRTFSTFPLNESSPSLSSMLSSPRTDDLVDSLDPTVLANLTNNIPPFLICHGDEDQVVPLWQSETLADTLRAAGGAVTFYTIPGGGHAQFDDPMVPEITNEFLALYLKTKLCQA